MEILLKYSKEGLVNVAAPGYEPINFENPFGQVESLPIDPITGALSVVSKITDADGLNSIRRQHTVEMDLMARQAWVEFFFLHAARLLREQFPEFSGLTITPESLQNMTEQGIDLSFLSAQS